MADGSPELNSLKVADGISKVGGSKITAPRQPTAAAKAASKTAKAATKAATEEAATEEAATEEAATAAGISPP